MNGISNNRFRKVVISTVFLIFMHGNSTTYAAAINYPLFSEHVTDGVVGIGTDVTWTGEVENGVAKTPNLCVPCAAGLIILAAGFFTYLYGSDPEQALLISEFELDGVNVLDDLIAEATLPGNVVLTQYFPDILGGSTFYGSTAYSGKAYVNNVLAADMPIGFGVFSADSGQSYFSPIIFADSAAELTKVTSYEWDLTPAIPSDYNGTFSATARNLVAAPSTLQIPEPPTILLFGALLLMLLARPERNGRFNNCNDKRTAIA